MSEEHPFYRLQSVRGFRDSEEQNARGKQDEIRPQTVEYSSSWLNFLIIVCLMIAWYFPLKILISYWVWPNVDRGELSSYEFVALAYEGVSDKESDVNPEQFKEHIETLITNGYNPITLEEVRDLYQQGKPLPKKPVLISFDHSRKSSFFDTRSIIRRKGWFATLFLWVSPIDDMDNATLLWPYLRAMLRSDSWEVGAQSYDGFAQIPSSPDGSLGNFMTSPQWLADKERYETLPEFSERLSADHRKSIERISEKLGVEPIAYAYPYGDFGQFKARSTVIHAVNLSLVEQNYDLGFLTGNLALNTIHSDPRRLNRLLVSHEWSGEDLVNYLENCWPVSSPARGPVRASELPWIVDWGSTENGMGGEVSLYAPENATGAKMWLAGSDLNKDFYAKVRFRLSRGQLGLYLRATPDTESYIYLGLDTGGDVWLRQMKKSEDEEGSGDSGSATSDIWLRQKEVATERFTLASAHVEIAPQSEHTIEVFLRGNLLFARLDGGEVFKQRTILRGKQRPGMFGLSIWSPEPGAARVAVESVQLHQQDKAMLCWQNGNPDFDPYMFKWVHDNAYRLTDISPEWLSVDTLGRAQESDIEPSAYALLAKINHLNLYPQVTIDDENDLRVLTPQMLSKRAAEAQVDGVYLDMQRMVAGAGKQALSWLKNAADALAEAGLDIVMELPPQLESRSELLSMLAMMPNSKIVLEKDSELADSPDIDDEAVVEKELLPPPADRSEIPLFYQIESLAGSGFDESVESRVERLYNEGMAAYQAGDYDLALRAWLEWLEIEPQSARALMLLGDVEARLGDLEAALAYYDRSMEIDPGQIVLELRRIRLLDTLGRHKEAAEALNLYARLFPANTEILIAQAEWLKRRDRNKEAIDVARKVLSIEPDNMKSLAFVLLYSEQRQERIDARDRIVALAERPIRHYELGKLIWDFELLSLEDSEPLVQMASRIAAETDDARVKDIFTRLRPRYAVVNETFVDDQVSDAWWILGGRCATADQLGLLQAAGTHKEVSMRLLGSLHLEQQYVETDIVNCQGDLWLYARRSAKHMIRFGFTSENKIYLQVWVDGKLASNKNREWRKPSGRFSMRLEVCGDAAIGYIDGKPVFTPYVNLPPQLGQGWVGLAVSDGITGRAAATLSRLSAGPTPPRIALLQPALSEDMSDFQLQTIRRNIDALMGISPRWYSLDLNGNWKDEYSGDKELFRLFCRYYRFWLMPTVAVADIGGVDAMSIRAFADREKLDGVILMVEQWPGKAWFERMNSELSGSGLKLVLAMSAGDGSSIRMQGLGSGRRIFADAAIEREFEVYDAEELPAAAAPANRSNPLIFRL